MRRFLNEYGKTILVAIVLIILIAIVTGLADPILISLKDIATSTSDKTTTIKNYDDEDVDILSKEWKPLEMTDVDMETDENIAITGNFTPGEIVSIGDGEYRVLSTDGTKAKILSLSAQGTTIFDSNTNQYAESALDNSLNNFYENLPNEIKESIVEEDISQSFYKLTNGTNNSADLQIVYSDTSENYYFEKVNTVTVGNRKVYALGLEEIIEFLGSSINNIDLNRFVFNIETIGSDVWLRSGTTVENLGMALFGSNGRILDNRNIKTDNFSYHPVFTLDLRLLHDLIYEIK